MGNPKGYANPELLIDPPELARRLETGAAAGATPGTAGETPVLLDLRPAEAFAAGHIPGAAHLDLFGLSLIDTDPAPLAAFLWIIAHLLTSRVASTRRVRWWSTTSSRESAPRAPSGFSSSSGIPMRACSTEASGPGSEPGFRPPGRRRRP